MIGHNQWEDVFVRLVYYVAFAAILLLTAWGGSAIFNRAVDNHVDRILDQIMEDAQLCEEIITDPDEACLWYEDEDGNHSCVLRNATR